MDLTEKMKRCHEYMEALEEERRKIQVFQRELPLSLDLINQAIENCRQKIEKKENCQVAEEEEGEDEEMTSGDEGGGPVLEEFIPLKRTPSSSDFNNNNKHSSIKSNNDETTTTTTTTTKAACSNNKVDWMKSVQLWNQNPDPVPKQDLPKKTPVIESKKNGGAFHPFHKSKEATSTITATTTTATTTTTTTTTAVTTPPSSIATSSTTETLTECGENNNNNNSRRELEKERERHGQGQSSSRKTRRCWSPELHRRFCQALQQLGGAHVATPKQIRELMKVDGLTNDEVKSHLQKYRLHTRRPSPTINSNGNPRQPQFVVVGGIWVPPQEYNATVVTKGGDSNRGNSGIYAPVALQPQVPSSIYPHNKQHLQQQHKQLQLSPTSPLHCEDEGRTSRADHSIEDNEDDDGDNDNVGNSSSPSMSSYTHNSTVSALSL